MMNPFLLLAEPNPHLRAELLRWFRYDGYDVTGVADGHALSRVLAERRGLEPAVPDLLVTNEDLPKRGGLEIIEALRREDHRTRVVLLTAARSMELERQAKRLGVSAVLGMPFDTDDLRTVLALLASRDARLARAPA